MEKNIKTASQAKEDERFWLVMNSIVWAFNLVAAAFAAYIRFGGPLQ